ncbi:MAG: GAF domain-containing sensor histidine kinase [Nitrospirota bacterium]|nr:GAF domain-containing sensor histidine kinase [Nitrospirota bacterium]
MPARIRPQAEPRRSRPAQLAKELEAARRISQALSRQTDVDSLISHALRTALEVVGADAASVLLADPASKQLVFRHVIGQKAKRLRGTAIPWDQGIASVVFKSGKPHLSADVSKDRRHLTRVDASIGYQTKDMITLPLKPWEGKPIGVLQVLNKRRGRLGRKDLSILTIISALMSAAIMQARLYEEVKFAEVGRLLGDIGHDVGNLLTPVLCSVDLLGPQLEKFLDGLKDQESAETMQMRRLSREVLGLLKTSARRIQDQVKQMADCVKGLSTEPQFLPCRIESVVEQAQHTLSLLANEHHIELRREQLAGLPPILADERRLYLAFYNLINNAISEVPPGGSITVRGAYEPKGRQVMVSVIDTGRGMSPDVQASLFSSRAISRKAGGTGLGTKIVKDVVVAHGGQINVESQEGVGTAFHLWLPVQPPASSSERKRSKPAAGVRG